MRTGTGMGIGMETGMWNGTWGRAGDESLYVMDLEQAMRRRHSVRSYTDEPIGIAERAELEREIARCNAEGGLDIRLVLEEPEAFDSALAHYGKMTNVRNYIVVAGTPAPDLDERCGYYGERLVLLAQQLGLNTCWVALTFKKRFVRKSLAAGRELVVVIAIGHGAVGGMSRRSKTFEQVAVCPDPASVPDWFRRGVEAALLAPTAVNQQKFTFELVVPGEDAASGETGVSGKPASGKASASGKPAGKPAVRATTKGGPYTGIDLGIAKLHFELGAGKGNFVWA